jgi:hypothetical protein
MVTLPGGHVVELLEYSAPESATSMAPRPCDVGGAHLALEVESVAETTRSIERFGFVVQDRILALPGGPFAGRYVTYVRDQHGFTLELIGGQ